MRHRRPPRVFGFPYTGFYRYSLTFCTLRRRPLFTIADVVSAAHEQLLRTAEEEDMDILAYCFMPDHVHVLAEGRTEAADLQRFVKIAKQRVAFVLRAQGLRDVWQEGYYDRILRDEMATAEAVRYILNNPVRRGLVGVAWEYPFSGTKYGSVKDALT